MRLAGKHAKKFDALVRLIGIDATVLLCQEYGGKTVYIPKIRPFYTYRRNLAIYNDWLTKKYSKQELAWKWGLTRPAIYQIVGKMELLLNEDSANG